MAATIKDIKELTGLSLATISKYLNGGNLRPENRAKIEKAISELHYEVNEMARGLVTSRSKVIGVVVFDIANVFTCTLLKYLGENFRRAGYAPMICDSQNDPELETENVRFLLSKKVDGMIVIPAGQTAAFLQPARNAGIPLVLMDRSLKGSGIDCVKVNNTASSYQAVEKLYDYGHRRIAIIGSDLEITGKERLDGYLKLLEEKKISVPPQYIKLGPHSIEHGYKSMQELLKLEEPPTAVFMGNFEIILGAVMALNESLGNNLNPEEMKAATSTMADYMSGSATMGKMAFPGKSLLRNCRKENGFCLPGLWKESRLQGFRNDSASRELKRDFIFRIVKV